MTALDKDRQTASKEIDLKSYLCDVDHIYKGGLVALNAAGYAVAATDSATDVRVVGVADENVDCTVQGAKKVRVRSGRAFLFAASSITQAMLGDTMVVVDDQTVDDAGGATNDVTVGHLIEYVSSTSGWVFIPLGGIATR